MGENTDRELFGPCSFSTLDNIPIRFYVGNNLPVIGLDIKADLEKQPVQQFWRNVLNMLIPTFCTQCSFTCETSKARGLLQGTGATLCADIWMWKRPMSKMEDFTLDSRSFHCFEFHWNISWNNLKYLSCFSKVSFSDALFLHVHIFVWTITFFKCCLFGFIAVCKEMCI